MDESTASYQTLETLRSLIDRLLDTFADAEIWEGLKSPDWLGSARETMEGLEKTIESLPEDE